MVRDGNVVGVQFHPEKSSAAGVRFLRDIVSAAANCRSFAKPALSAANVLRMTPKSGDIR
jgi:hypothetical protein